MPDVLSATSPVRSVGDDDFGDYQSAAGNEHIFNILLLGDQAVGKSTLSNRFISGSTTAGYMPTVGVNFYFRTIKVDGYNTKLQLWDTAGESRFMPYLHESHFEKADCVILMYDITKKETFSEMKLWIEHIRQHCAGKEKVIVGNKADLADDGGSRQIEEDKGRALAEKFEFGFLETCSLDARSVERLFLMLARSMILSYLRRQCRQYQLSSSMMQMTPIQKLPASMLSDGTSHSQPSSAVKRKPNISKKALRDECDVLFKVLLVGEASVGKTSLMCRYVHRQFSTTYKTTVGVDFESHLIKLHDKVIKLVIWDTAGQEKFKALSPQYYRGADAVVVVYDVSCRHTFDSVLSWVQSSQMRNNSDDTVLAIVGNKCDLNPKFREVDERLGIQISESLGIDLFMETSAKNNVNIGELFESIAIKAIAKKKIDLTTLGQKDPTADGNLSMVIQPGRSKSASSWQRLNNCC